LLSDLRESGSLEQGADCIIFLWHGEYYNSTEYEDGTATAHTSLFDMAKHRTAPLMK
jgi:replicative DNA helicase